MAIQEITDPGLAVSIKAIMVAAALVLGVITLGAFLAWMGSLTWVYGFIGVVLLAQALLYAVL